MSVKDSVCKEFFQVPERFADVCNGILFAGNNVVDPVDISPAETENIYIEGTKDKKTIVDIAKYWKKNGTTLGILILENQTKVDYGMVVRNMLTEAISYNRQIIDIARTHKQNNELNSDDYICGIKKDDRLTPVLTLVLYLGKDPWDGARYLHEILTIDDNLKACVTNYHINLYDYHDYNNYDEFNTDVGLAFKSLSSRNDKNKLRQIFNDSSKLLEADTARFIAKMLDIKNIDRYIAKDENGKEQVAMCKAIDDIRLEGYDLKTISIIIKQVKKNRSLDIIADNVDEEIEYIRPMYNAVIANPDKDAEAIYRILYNLEK